jgi:hypothetical protein
MKSLWSSPTEKISESVPVHDGVKYDAIHATGPVYFFNDVCLRPFCNGLGLLGCEQTANIV